MTEFSLSPLQQKLVLSVAQGYIYHRTHHVPTQCSTLVQKPSPSVSQPAIFCIFWGKVFKSDFPPGLSALPSAFSPGGARAVCVKPLFWE